MQDLFIYNRMQALGIIKW